LPSRKRIRFWFQRRTDYLLPRTEGGRAAKNPIVVNEDGDMAKAGRDTQKKELQDFGEMSTGEDRLPTWRRRREVREKVFRRKGFDMKVAQKRNLQIS